MAKSKENETRLVCPNCGTEFAIPEHETIGIGVFVGKDSNLGTIHPEVVGQPVAKTAKTKKQMKADEKLAALAAAGIDTANLFSMSGITGEEKVARLKDGQVTVIPDDDPIFAAIAGGKTVPNNRLFRRWVMSQVFHMMTYEHRGSSGFTAALNLKGYQYQWKMLLEELRVQAILAKNDPENFRQRNLWFNKGRVYDMCQDYIGKLYVHIGTLPRKHCKGIPYIRLRGHNVFESDIAQKVLAPLKAAAVYIFDSPSPVALERRARRFYDLVKNTWLHYDITMSSSFKDAYKGAGAYFTMRNLILFHSCRMRDVRGRYLPEKGSIARLDTMAEEYRNEGWRLFGAMKELLEDNKVDIKKKMAEWRGR